MFHVEQIYMSNASNVPRGTLEAYGTSAPLVRLRALVSLLQGNVRSARARARPRSATAHVPTKRPQREKKASPRG